MSLWQYRLAMVAPDLPMTQLEAMQAPLGELEQAAAAGDFQARVQLDIHEERTRNL